MTTLSEGAGGVLGLFIEWELYTQIPLKTGKIKGEQYNRPTVVPTNTTERLYIAGYKQGVTFPNK